MKLFMKASIFAVLLGLAACGAGDQVTGAEPGSPADKGVAEPVVPPPPPPPPPPPTSAGISIDPPDAVVLPPVAESVTTSSPTRGLGSVTDPEPVMAAAPAIPLTPKHRFGFPDDKDPKPGSVALPNGVETSVLYKLTRDQAGPSGTEVDAGVSVNLRDAIESGAEHFYVYFSCLNCAPSDNQQNRADLNITDADAESNTITFSLTPTFAGGLPGEYGVTKAAFRLYRNGLLLDTLVLDTCVAPAASLGAACGFTQAPSADTPPPFDWVSQGIADVVATISDSAAASSPASPDTSTDTDVAVVDLGLNSPPSGFNDALAGGGEPDINLIRQTSPQGGTILNIAVYNTDLAADLRAKNIAPDSRRDLNGGGLQFFFAASPKLSNQGDLDAKAIDIYRRLSCLVQPQTGASASLDVWSQRKVEFLEWLQTRLQGSCAASPNAGARGSWGPERTAFVGEQLRKFGQAHVTKYLFRDRPGQEFVDAIAAYAETRRTDDPSAKALKLKADLPGFPLQLMHPSGRFSATSPKFFGYLFDIAIDPGTNSMPNGVYSRSDYEFGKVAFAGFESEVTERDKLISAYSKAVYDDVTRSLTNSAAGSSEFITDPARLVDYLSENAGSVDLIWTYAHGDAQALSNENPDAFDLMSPSPNLILRRQSANDYDALTRDDLSTIHDRLADQIGPPLSRAPIVVLVACESGAPVLGGAGGRPLIEEFFALGASAIISTEAEIEDKSAIKFGQALTDYLEGENAGGPSAGVLHARRKMFENGDLWGLLFNYTGPHGRTLVTEARAR